MQEILPKRGQLAFSQPAGMPSCGEKGVSQLFEEQVDRTPEAVALAFEEEEISYRELNQRVRRVASALMKMGIGPNMCAGLYVGRPVEMMVGMLSILKAGGAFLPLAVTDPKTRLIWMLDDSQATLLVTEEKLRGDLEVEKQNFRVLCLDRAVFAATQDADAPTGDSVDVSTNLASISYSGPSALRAVRMTHREVLNVFAGLDRLIGTQPGVWLASSKASQQPATIELLWALTRGFKLVFPAELAVRCSNSERAPAKGQLDFSLFYFGSDAAGGGADKYRLLLEGAKFADEQGFAAVWTPERHFHSIGGIYPNPSLSSAAIAVLTRNIQIRAGSVVLPLHNPLRVAEEWSVVDNLSKGRAAISLASGWHANDFALAPDNYSRRKEIMLEGIETLRRLWQGESVKVPNGHGEPVNVRIFPQPVQRELPMWLTSSGNPETFQWAGEMGLNLLTHLFGQGLGDLERKLEIYRAAWRKHGHHGREPQVSVMMHTFVWGDRAGAWETVQGPLCEYLRTFRELNKTARPPTGPNARPNGPAVEEAPGDVEVLLRKAAERYFESSGLFGPPENCLPLLEKLRGFGVNELACLIDFGIEDDTVLAGLDHLQKLRVMINQRGKVSVPGEVKKDPGQENFLSRQIRRHRVTHLQCNGSEASSLLEADQLVEALQSLDKILLSGEPTPIAVSQKLAEVLPGRVLQLGEQICEALASAGVRPQSEAQSTPAQRVYDRARRQREVFTQNTREK